MLPQIQYDNMILLLGKNNVVERYAKEMLNIDLFRKWGDITIIAKELFDECFCPCDGIGRVCLRGDTINPGINFPKELVDKMKKKDGEEYTPSCFSVDVVDESTALLYYTTYIGDYIELGVIDNAAELKKYYLETANKSEIRETGWS